MQFTYNAKQGLVSPLDSGYLAYPPMIMFKVLSNVHWNTIILNCGFDLWNRNIGVLLKPGNHEDAFGNQFHTFGNLPPHFSQVW